MEDVSPYVSMVMMIIGGFAITNTVYLEKFYLTNKKDKLPNGESYNRS